MTHRNKTLGLLLSTAITAPLAAPAFAQTIEINDEQLARKTEECRILGERVMGMQQPIEIVPPQEIVTAINEDTAETCVVLTEQLAQAGEGAVGEPLAEGEAIAEDEAIAAGGMIAADGVIAEAEAIVIGGVTGDATGDVQASEVVTAQENLELAVDAQARATVPDPNVDVAVPGPTVRVMPSQPQVAIDQGAPEIALEQPQPTVAVEIPEIVVRLQIPAPRIYMLRPEPNVQVISGEPQIEVEQGEPVVEVTQPDPNVAIALDDDEIVTSDGGAADEEIAADGAEGAEGAAPAEGNVTVTTGEPTIEYVQAEGEPQVDIQSGEPTVSYQRVDPQVSLVMTEQPTIEIEQVGEPTLILETPEEREQRQGAALGEQEAGEGAAAGGMLIGDLLEMEVVTADGEGLGNPEAVIDMNGSPALVVADGGFLGLGGTQVPVPLSNVTLEGEELVLRQLTEDQIEEAGEFEYNEELALPEDTRVQFGN